MHSKLIAILYTLTHVIPTSAANIVANILLFLSFESAQIIHCIGYKVEKEKKTNSEHELYIKEITWNILRLFHNVSVYMFALMYFLYSFNSFAFRFEIIRCELISVLVNVWTCAMNCTSYFRYVAWILVWYNFE